MLKNSIVYRRLWYIRKRNIRRIHILIRLTLAVLILSFTAIAFNGRLLPVLRNSAESGIKSVVESMVADAVKNTFPGNLTYEDAVIMNKSADGSMTSIELNTARLNMLSAFAAEKLGEELDAVDNKTIDMFFFNMEIQKYGNIEMKYISDFKQAGVNRSKHCIWLEITVGISYKSPFLTGRTVITDTVPIAEALIIGNIQE